jgi:hypothetical protein
MLDDLGSTIGRGRDFSRSHYIQTSCVTHPAHYLVIFGALSLGVKRLVCETDHSLPSSAEVKNVFALPPSCNMALWHCALLFLPHVILVWTIILTAMLHLSISVHADVVM